MDPSGHASPAISTQAISQTPMNPQSTDLDYADPASSPLTFGVREGGLLILKVKGVPKRTNRCTSFTKGSFTFLHTHLGAFFKREPTRALTHLRE